MSVMKTTLFMPREKDLFSILTVNISKQTNRFTSVMLSSIFFYVAGLKNSINVDLFFILAFPKVVQK